MNAPLTYGAAELRLPTIRAQWESVAETANREGWPAERCLSTLLEMEIAEREIRVSNAIASSRNCRLASCARISTLPPCPAYPRRW